LGAGWKRFFRGPDSRGSGWPLTAEH
jgi:hypothetical protein